MNDKKFLIYVETSNIDEYGFIKEFDNYNSLEYTKRFTQAKEFTEKFLRSEEYLVLTRLLDSIPFCQYHIFEW